MSIRWLTAIVALSLSACGGRVVFDDGGSGGGTDASTGTGTSTSTGTLGVTQACLDYCDAVASSQGCFTLDDCHERCEAFYQPSCAAEVEAMLTCLPEWLSDACQIYYAENPPYGCQPEIDGVAQCAIRSSGCFVGAELVGSTGCVGSGECDAQRYEVRCDDDGGCSCEQNGEPVGACAMPFTGVEPCSLDFSCCRPFFGF
jgi:hypothetical protein